MQALDDVLGRDADSRNEEFGFTIDDYADELVEFSLCVVVARLLSATTFNRILDQVLGLSCTSSDLWKQKIHTKGCVLVVQVSLEFRNLFS